MNKPVLILLAILTYGITYGQKEEKKVITTKKEKVITIKDDDGKIKTLVTREAEGDLNEAEMEEMLKNTKDGEFINVNINNDNGKETKEYTLTKIKDGHKEIIKWNGEGEMPSQMRDKIKDIDIQEIDDDEMVITVDTRGDEKDNTKEIKKYVVIKKDGDEEKIFQWSGENNMPEELSGEFQDIDVEHGVDGKVYVKVRTKDDDNDQEHHVNRNIRKDKESASRALDKEHRIERNVERMERYEKKPKVSLGVMIEDEGQGVTISEIVNGSIAQEVGIRAGDTILKIGDDYIFSTNSLMDTLRKYELGDKIKVVVLRGGKEKKFKVQF